MSVRCRRFSGDGYEKVQWTDSEPGVPVLVGVVAERLHDAVCAFIRSLSPGDLAAVTECVGQYGRLYVSVYYRTKES